jgi:type II secretory pathway component GspD/PulD (secretin)
VDPRNLPLGAPLFLSTTVPVSNAALQRLVMAQDTGGAIRGVVRADLFEGLGEAAGERAGLMRQQGKLWLLWPKGRPLPAPGPGVAPAAASTAATQPVALQSLLQQQSQVTGRRFVVDPKVPAQLRVTNGTDTGSWAAVLAVLRGNGLAAFTAGGITNVVPDTDIRSQPLPVISTDDATIADDEWVTRTVAVRYLDATQLLPVLRPLLPQSAHLAVVPGSNALLVVDRYANTRRLIATLQEMDKPPAR